MANQSNHPRPANDTTDRTPAIWASGLSLEIDDRPILQDISITVDEGQSVALLGANGAGKSTLLKVLATLTFRNRGQLELFGREVGPTAVSIRSRIGIIAHQPMLYRDLSILENLEFFGRLYEVDKPTARATELLEFVELSHRTEDQVKTLSRGMTQRVSIARALMHDPDLLLADEPFSGLDEPSRNVLEAFLGHLRTDGKTVVLSNHDIVQSLKLADSVIVLRKGRLVLEGAADQLSAEMILKEMDGA